MKILKIIAKVWLYAILAAIVCGIAVAAYHNKVTIEEVNWEGAVVAAFIIITLASILVVMENDDGI